MFGTEEAVTGISVNVLMVRFFRSVLLIHRRRVPWYKNGFAERFRVEKLFVRLPPSVRRAIPWRFV